MTNEEAHATFKRVTTLEPWESDSPVYNASMDFVFGQVWNQPGLSDRERRLVSLTCAAYSGHPEPLEYHVRAALGSGDFTVEDLRYFAVHLAAYAGFPVATSIETMLVKIGALPAGSSGEAE